MKKILIIVLLLALSATCQGVQPAGTSECFTAYSDENKTEFITHCEAVDEQCKNVLFYEHLYSFFLNKPAVECESPQQICWYFPDKTAVCKPKSAGVLGLLSNFITGIWDVFAALLSSISIIASISLIIIKGIVFLATHWKIFFCICEVFIIGLSTLTSSPFQMIINYFTYHYKLVLFIIESCINILSYSMKMLDFIISNTIGILSRISPL